MAGGLLPIDAYPFTVPKGSERLRITPTPFHQDHHIEQLAAALLAVWHKLDLNLDPYWEVAAE